MTPEKELEQACIKTLQKLGGSFRKFGNYSHGVCRNRKGQFDYLIAYENNLVWIEFKATTKPSKEQKEFQKWIIDNGGEAYICYSVFSFIKLLNFIKKSSKNKI